MKWRIGAKIHSTAGISTFLLFFCVMVGLAWSQSEHSSAYQSSEPAREVESVLTENLDDQVNLDTPIEPETLPAPPTLIEAKDKPYDAGGAIEISWTLSTDDLPSGGSITAYLVYRAEKMSGPFNEIGSVPPGTNRMTDSSRLVDGLDYYYRVAAKSGESLSMSSTSAAAQSKAQWLAFNRWNIFVLAVIFSAFILINIKRAKSGQELFVRRIAGLNAVEEAIGRATEMGRMVLYVPGIMDMDDVQTIASINILGQVAKKTAEYDTTLMVPTCRSVVMSTAQEVVKESYLSVGRPDAYREDNIRYLTDDQFGYAAGVDGIMLRERPATNFFLGRFYAESLILAETGNFIGAIQIAGTAEASQIPFFITACDYTLIGEELFAAGAYLSREPMLLGSLKGQDWGKFLAMIAIIAGVILECLDIHFLTQFFTVG
ncbi:fibronectin type III domain-containing protein [bacterium]|nr:fibronectin type III domain-containing protein [bacterium]